MQIVRRSRALVIVGSSLGAMALGACGDGSAATGSSDSTGTASGAVAISAYDCLVNGVNTNPFTVAKALAANTADHELASDYTWNAASEIPIVFNGSSITITGTGATATGSTLTIASAGTYRISGTLTNGQILVSTKDTGVVRLVLDNASVTNASDAALVVTKAKKAVLMLADNSTNRFVDGATYPTGVDQNAAVFSKTNLSIGGNGTLVVQGRFEDGLTSKDGLVIASGTVNVTAVDDGIRGKDYLVIRTGTFTVTSGGDALKSDEDGDAALGYILIQGGQFTLTSGGDALAAETDALVSSGSFTIKAGGGSGVTISDTLSAKAVKGNANVVIDGGTFSIDAADDGLHSNSNVVVNGGTLTIATGDDGVHSDTTVTINAGSIDVTKSYEGVESGVGDLVFNGGTVRVVSSDDGINMAGAGDAPPGAGGGASSKYFLRVNGGRITSIASGDGVDVNGSATMTGGCVIVHGPTANNNAAVDYDGTFQITGGFLVAAGSAGMAQAPGSSSTQASALISFSSTRSAGTLVHLQSSAGVDVLDFAPSKAFQTLVISSPKLVSGSAYSLFTGGSVTGTPNDGLYQSGTYTPGSKAGTFTASTVSRVTF